MTPMTLTEAEADVWTALAFDDLDAINAAAAVLDRFDVRPPLPSLGASALWYAEQGLAVFRLQPGRKTPLPGSRGCKDATTDLEQVRAWWTEHPEANIGIATGHLVDVIDLDGLEGQLSWLRLVEEPPTIYGKVSTPRPGGGHLYVAAVPGTGNRAGILPSVDYRGTGGYVVAPPSVITEGNGYPGRYEWVRPIDVAAIAAEVAA